ncbi:MAG: hypothetical protein IKD70_00865 [Eggerthellaceae bacterium]|nr:hypothetical protein [Eggerthellaceae bacterium]
MAAATVLTDTSALPHLGFGEAKSFDIRSEFVELKTPLACLGLRGIRLGLVEERARFHLAQSNLPPQFRQPAPDAFVRLDIRGTGMVFPDAGYTKIGYYHQPCDMLFGARKEETGGRVARTSVCHFSLRASECKDVGGSLVEIVALATEKGY